MSSLLYTALAIPPCSFVSNSTSYTVLFFLAAASGFNSAPVASSESPVSSPSAPIRIFPFNVKPSGDPCKPHISYIPWTKAELRVIVKEFPNVTKDSNRFAEEFDIILQAYHLGFSDVYQLINMLVCEVQAICWMRIAEWEHPERDLEKQTPDYWEEARKLARKLHRAIPKAFPKAVDWSKILDCSQRPDESINDS